MFVFGSVHLNVSSCPGMKDHCLPCWHINIHTKEKTWWMLKRQVSKVSCHPQFASCPAASAVCVWVPRKFSPRVQALQAVQKMITEIKFKNISVKNCQVSLIHSLTSLHSESTLRCSAFALVPPFKSSLPALSPWHLESLRDNWEKSREETKVTHPPSH